MRLLRLTTRNDTALFESTYNTEIILKPYSKIALQSASIDSIPNDLIINSTNNQLQYQIIMGYSNIIQLTQKNYVASQINELLKDITDKLNNSIKYVFGVTTSNKPLGLEWLASKIDDKISIEYKIGKSNSYFTGTTTQWIFNNTEYTAVQSLISANVIPEDDFKSNLGLPYTISKGNGFFRSRMYKLEYDINTPQQGYLMGVISDFDKVDSDVLELSDIIYGVRVRVDGIENRTIETIINGQLTGNIVSVNTYFTNSNNNEYTEIAINGDVVEINQYSQVGGVTEKVILDSDIYDNNNLYPVFVFFGKKSTVACNGVRVTPSPFGNMPILSHTSEDFGLNSPPQPPPNPNTNAENFLFMDVVVAKYLGYDNSRQPVNAFKYGVEIKYTAQYLFKISEVADALLVELMNLKIESYDSYSNTQLASGGQRRNLLSVIPSTNSTGKIIYEPNYPTFLDLNNSEPLTLRNLNIRVVREDYSQIEINGMGTLVILID